MTVSRSLKMRKIGVQTPESVLLKPVKRGRSVEPSRPQSNSCALTQAQTEALDKKLAAFDPMRHGGEVMAARPVGREVL